MNQVDAINSRRRGSRSEYRDGYQSTPLLLAAFFGQAESVEYLLRGSQPKLKNKDGALPAQAMMADRTITEWVAGIF